MKNKVKQLSVILTLLLFFQSSITYAKPFKLTRAPEGETFLVLDRLPKKQLPPRFRAIRSLGMSGSAQFTPSQLHNIVKQINMPNIYIIDLRQEAHGFVNDLAVSYYNSDEYPFKGFNSEDVLGAEKNLFGSIKIGENINIYSKNGVLNKTVLVESTALEPQICTDANVKYKLFAVKDGTIPTATMVDTFVEFIKNKPSDAHLHFHCKEGQGRTTTFMALYQMMIDTKNLSLEEILSEQVDAGGIVLTSHKKRAQFLDNFYNYVKENSTLNYSTPYSQWNKRADLDLAS